MASEAAGSSPSADGTARRRERKMDGNFSIGRYGGVEVRLNWSLIAVFVLIVWSLADGVLPSQNPGLSDGTYLKDRFASPGSEFRVALAGPLVSIGLGVVFVLIALAGLPSAVDGAAAWLGYINLILAAFNLVPASPLDGGRVLHSALWRAKGDYALATRIASEIGQGFGYLFIALGLAMFIFQGSFSGAWLAFLGWFLLQAATAEARYVATQQALDGLRVRDLMVRNPVTVDADSTIGHFLDDVARSRRFTTYPVLDGGSPVGLLAFSSVAAVPRSEWDTRRVRDTMIPLEDVPLLTEDEPAVDALADLSSPTANRGLVIEGGHLAGLLSITDLARALEVGRRPATPAG